MKERKRLVSVAVCHWWGHKDVRVEHEVALFSTSRKALAWVNRLRRDHPLISSHTYRLEVQ